MLRFVKLSASAQTTALVLLQLVLSTLAQPLAATAEDSETEAPDSVSLRYTTSYRRHRLTRILVGSIIGGIAGLLLLLGCCCLLFRRSRARRNRVSTGPGATGGGGGPVGMSEQQGQYGPSGGPGVTQQPPAAYNGAGGGGNYAPPSGPPPANDGNRFVGGFKA